MHDHDDTQVKARKDYDRALRRSFWRKLRSGLKRGCNDLMPAGQVFQHLNLRKRHELGLQDVPIDSIVGSSGRIYDFDLAFLPRRRENDDRWVNIAWVRRQASALPPVLLYKVGKAYFVEDGNHRVSVARARGEKSIQAVVVEIDASGLEPEPSCTRLGYKAKQT